MSRKPDHYLKYRCPECGATSGYRYYQEQKNRTKCRKCGGTVKGNDTPPTGWGRQGRKGKR